MKFLGVLFFALVVIFAGWASAGLWRVKWQDRKLPKAHPDYTGLYWGKRMVTIAAACCTLVAVAAAWAIAWCLK